MHALKDRLFSPVDAASLVFFRIAFGVVMVWEVLRYFANGWIKRYWIDPDFHFSYFGFDWVSPLPGPGMYILVGLLGLLSCGIAAGFRYRICAVLFFLGFTYLFLLEQARYLNHFYLICLIAFVLAVISPLRGKTGYLPAWQLYLVRALVGIAYFYAGVAKINADWLACEPMRMWLHARTEFPLIGQWFSEEWMVHLFSYGGLFLDLLIVPALLWKRTRLVAYLAICLFHLLNTQLFSIGIFPWMMILLTTIFFEPNWPRKLFKQAQPGEKPVFTHARWVLPFLAVFLSIQVVLPLRHWLYPGNVSWTEEGHSFSWHMKLRDKRGSCELHFHDPETGEEWIVRPRELLPEWQYRKMRGRPDMIIQYAHEMGRQRMAEGRSTIEVFAVATCALNRRRACLLIDPMKNLMKEKRSLKPKSWVLPLKEPMKPLDEWYGEQ